MLLSTSRRLADVDFTGIIRVDELIHSLDGYFGSIFSFSEVGGAP